MYMVVEPEVVELSPIAFELYAQVHRLRDEGYKWLDGQPQDPGQSCAVNWIQPVEPDPTSILKLRTLEALEALKSDKGNNEFIENIIAQIEDEWIKEEETEVSELSEEAQDFLTDFVDAEIDKVDWCLGIHYRMSIVEWNDSYATDVEQVIRFIESVAEFAEELGI